MTAEIMLLNGEAVSIFDPEVGHKLTPAVLAASLARECRFARQTRQFYSVAAHTMLCAGLADNENDFVHCIMHDTAESILGDMPRPIKKLMPEYRDIELGLLYRIFAAYRSERYPLTLPLPPMVKRIDGYVLALEASHLMPEFETSEYWADQRELLDRWGRFDLVRFFQWGDTPTLVEGDELFPASNQYVLENMLDCIVNHKYVTLWGSGFSWREVTGPYMISGISKVREQLRDRGFYDV